MVNRKLFRTGNSLTVTIPSTLASELKIKAGDHVEIQIDREHDGLLLRPVREDPSVSDGPVSPEFVEWADAFVDRYRDALTKLGGR